MKNFIQNTSLNRVLLALAVSVAAGGVASASPAGTVTSTISDPANGTYYSAADLRPFQGSIAATPNGVDALATYSYYFVGANMTYLIDSGTFPVYANAPGTTTESLTFEPGKYLTVGFHQAKIDCTLSAPGKTNVPGNATNYFGEYQ
ncbi:hypothetical protein IAD21_01276 [Abditibacteriota bacterium]|nr:hypothetical protein IAD21_01276 [Abditibacteriota bacterium]